MRSKEQKSAPLRSPRRKRRNPRALAAGVLALLAWIQLTACTSPSGTETRRARPIDPPVTGELLPAEMETLHREVGELIVRADFKRADSLLREASRKELSTSQSQEIRRIRYDLRRTSFLHHHPLDLRVWTPKGCYAFDEKIPVYFEIFNLSEQSLMIPAPGFFSWLPGGERRKSLVLGEVVLTDISVEGGTNCRGKWNPVLEFEQSWVIDPGSSKRFEHELNLVTPEDTVYRRLEIRGELIPGGLQTGPFDWGPIRLAYSPLTIHVVRAEDLAIADEPEMQFDRGLEALDVRRILLASLLMNHDRRWEIADRIIGILQELAPGGKQAVMEGLRWITGENLGYDPYRWLDWWDVNRKDLLEQESRTGKNPQASRRHPVPACAPAMAAPPFPASGTFTASVLALCLPGFCRTACDDRKPILGKVSTAAEVDPDRIRRGLDDPYYGRRFATLRKLQALGQAGLPLLRSLISDESPRVRRMAAEALGCAGGEEAYSILTGALAKEAESGIRQRITLSLALISPDTDRKGIPPLIDGDARLRAIFVDAAVTRTLEDILHFGGIPGFYDGQFSALWSIAADVQDHLVEKAMDPDCAYQIRVLAIMALHEKKTPGMIDALMPLILDPRLELYMEKMEFEQPRFDEELVLQHRRRNLSKYARFSLAKAGYTQFNQAKIRVMEDWLQQNGGRAFRKPSRMGGIFGGQFDFDSDRLFGKNLILDIAYNYQQFDRYDMAEQWYQKLLIQFSDEEDFGLVAEAHYNLACLYSLTGKEDLAIKHLQQSVEKGFMDLSWMDRDKDLDAVRNLPAYQSLREQIINIPADGSAIIKRK